MNSTSRFTALLVLAVVAGVGSAIWLLARSGPVAVSPPQPPSIPPDTTASNVQEPVPPIASESAPQAKVTLDLTPRNLQLAGSGDGCQLLVTRHSADGGVEDLTRETSFNIAPPGLAEISRTGYLRALAPGTVELQAYFDGLEAAAVVTIRDAQPPVSDFALDIVPILTKAGCNSGSCHGAAQGKGGLALSLFGYDPESDHATMTRGLEGRRIDPLNPESSLLWLKPTLSMPHAGGLRLRPESADADRVRRWIAGNTPWLDDSRGRLERLTVEPNERFLPAAPIEQQLQVIAEYSDGTRQDVTRLCLYVSNDPSTIAVDKHGLAKLLRRGQADIVVRFANKVSTVRLAAPFNDAADFDFRGVPRRNFIDDRVVERLEHMRLPASPRSSDAEFLRRIYFDLIGHMPDPDLPPDADFVEEFLADTSPDKRDRVIDKLIKHPDFVKFWAIKFGDLLQINSAAMGTATGSYKLWLTDQLELNKSGKARSYAEIVRSLLLSKGNLKPPQLRRENGERVYYASPQEVGEIAEQAARRFLGVRIRCARCHDHPLDVWTQDDYYGFTSFFGGMRVEASNETLAQEVKIVQENSVKHLRTGETPKLKHLGGAVVEPGDREDVRELLVDWMLDLENPRFSRMAANWVWAHLIGRGLVEPVDDLRETNPPTHPALLDELSRHFRENEFDLRALIRTICQSETYQRTSTPLPSNEQDEQFLSHALLKPLTAHQLADSIAQVTRVPNTFGQNLGKGTRAIDINDPNIRDYMLDVLGRCDRSGGCEVGSLVRPTSLKQSLFMIISDDINGKLTRQKSQVSDWATAIRESEPSARPDLFKIQIERIHLRAYNRRPTHAETEFWLKHLTEADDPAEALEDMVWAILNSREFVVNH